MLQAEIKTRLILIQSDILSLSSRHLSVSEGIYIWFRLKKIIYTTEIINHLRKGVNTVYNIMANLLFRGKVVEVYFLILDFDKGSKSGNTESLVMII